MVKYRLKPIGGNIPLLLTINAVRVSHTWCERKMCGMKANVLKETQDLVFL
jgi:hypothetical protein